MAIKKLNAVLSLITILLLLAHIGYTSYSYLTMYYNPELRKFFIFPFMIAVMIHAVLGMLSVFLNSDGTALSSYPKLNRHTVLQRVTAALILPLVFLHTQTFNLMKENAEAGNKWVIWLLIIAEVLLFAAALAHAALSLSRALITFGLLKSRDRQIKIDRVCLIISGLILVFASYAVIKGQMTMFMG